MARPLPNIQPSSISQIVGQHDLWSFKARDLLGVTFCGSYLTTTAYADLPPTGQKWMRRRFCFGLRQHCILSWATSNFVFPNVVNTTDQVNAVLAAGEHLVQVFKAQLAIAPDDITIISIYQMWLALKCTYENTGHMTTLFGTTSAWFAPPPFAPPQYF
jgi:hypothetical protein